MILGVTASQKAEEIKKTSVSKAKTLYNDGIVEAALDGFDFSQEDSANKFEEKVARVASLFGVKPIDKPDVDNDKVEGLDEFVEELKDRYEQ